MPHKGWRVLLVFLMPMQLGEIARRETSVWPWKALTRRQMVGALNLETQQCSR